ncbi:hypothetical protein COJ46_01250 [Bacillus sp. AFS077874]|uniref:helix-turn-helix domain-containing protein n=1 Tax=unclassified Bacillus (in: firmicutes) TaxID=185979 RepID=UPI000BED90D9|nr:MULTISPECIES: helix-turn-helix transcriptional regulator [unclassified Bacillus (in: firmicutes)]PEC50937.1 hypothetical protein CON00_04275 [Bacillus sp. AFS096315]PFM83175.1 hypothetical protein COJ46_01250 [Bacillus sp. AFS077874]
MEITINLSEETVAELEKLVKYYKHNNLLHGKENDATIEDVIKGAIAMYLSWLPAKGRPLISNQSFIIENKIQSIFENQGKNQKEVTELTGVGRSTISNIWNGAVPTLENFIRIWLALGKPPIEQILTIKPVESE